ncbi:60S acidic ribosomal protein [Trema orientale]|uniref:60S acidic ribosomal protein n=1 Tax=Trema orientale TaxID=63057 RepID=A0A2P5C4Q5_TREOI|nr:60S acidic ribosomal protein [Trema orientale]
MKVIAAFMLAQLGGNPNPSADDIRHILGSVGAEAEEDKIKLLLSAVEGKDITELIAVGREKLASVHSGGSVAVPAAAAAGGAAAAPAEVESKKEEKEELIEESDDEPMFPLFDD